MVFDKGYFMVIAHVKRIGAQGRIVRCANVSIAKVICRFIGSKLAVVVVQMVAVCMAAIAGVPVAISWRGTQQSFVQFHIIGWIIRENRVIGGAGDAK